MMAKGKSSGETNSNLVRFYVPSKRLSQHQADRIRLLYSQGWGYEGYGRSDEELIASGLVAKSSHSPEKLREIDKKIAAQWKAIERLCKAKNRNDPQPMKALDEAIQVLKSQAYYRTRQVVKLTPAGIVLASKGQAFSMKVKA